MLEFLGMAGHVAVVGALRQDARQARFSRHSCWLTVVSADTQSSGQEPSFGSGHNMSMLVAAAWNFMPGTLEHLAGLESAAPRAAAAAAPASPNTSAATSANNEAIASIFICTEHFAGRTGPELAQHEQGYPRDC